jgi:hypothetical protein
VRIGKRSGIYWFLILEIFFRKLFEED